MTITELKNELSIESVGELNPDAVYVFRIHAITEATAEHFGKVLGDRGIRAIIVDENVTAIYKLDRHA